MPFHGCIMRALPSRSVLSQSLFGPHCRNPGGNQLRSPPPPRTVPQHEKRYQLSSVVGKKLILFPLLGPGAEHDHSPERRTPPPPPPGSAAVFGRRRFVVTRGGIIINPPGVFSVRHPGCRNGNDSSKLGQHEKHTTSGGTLSRRRPLSLALSFEEGS